MFKTLPQLLILLLFPFLGIAQMQNPIKAEFYISSYDCYKCVYPIDHLLKEFDTLTAIDSLSVISDSKVLIKKLKEDYSDLKSIHFFVNESKFKNVKDGLKSRIAIDEDGQSHTFLITDLNAQQLRKILELVNVVGPQRVDSIVDNRFEKGRYYDISGHYGDFFAIFEPVYPNLLLGNIDNGGFHTRYFDPPFDENQYSFYLNKARNTIGDNVMTWTDANLMAKRNNIELKKLVSATINKDTLIFAREVGFFYRSDADTVFRMFVFLESYLLSKPTVDSIAATKLNVDIISPVSIGPARYLPYLRNAFQCFDNHCYAYFRNNLDSKDSTKSICVAAQVQLQRNALTYPSLIFSHIRNFPDTIQKLLTTHLFGNGSIMYHIKQSTFIFLKFSNRVLNLDNGRIFTFEQWVESEFGYRPKEKIAFIKDIYYDGGRFKICYLSKNNKIVSLTISKTTKETVLTTDNPNGEFIFTKDKIISYKVNDDTLLLYSFPVE